MCGIAGFFDIETGAATEEMSARLRGMGDAVAHRGPDDADIWLDPVAGIGLAHRRLSILDLSPLGRQPMTSADGRYVITYNGEVDNFRELRAELEAHGHRFRGGSDTEAMLAACVEWGPEAAVKRFTGMFAFALWDRKAATLYLVRDRLGVKPLYWCRRGGVVLFGSELKALMAHPSWRADIDLDTTAAFLRYAYVPAPSTIFRNVYKLKPGTLLVLTAAGATRQAAYWQLADVLKPVSDPISDEQEAADGLEATLREAVRSRMISDVPLGAFLSGGIELV